MSHENPVREVGEEVKGGLAEDCDGEDSVEAVDVDSFAEVDFEGAEACPDDEFSGES